MAAIDASDYSKDSGSLFLRVFPSIMLPMFLAVGDQTIVATALPAIAASLGSVERVSWVVVAYLIASTVAAPMYGQLRDIFGGKRMMFVALAVFLLASLLCSVARSVEMLTAARILQGLGGGGLMTLSQSLIGETVPPRDRARYQGYLAAVLVTASTFGPVAGGYLTEHFGWRSIFLVNLPLVLLAIGLAARLPAHSGGEVKWAFDGPGLVWLMAFVVSLLLALQMGQRMSVAALPGVAGLMAVAMLAVWLLVRRERSAPHPLLPVNLLAQPTIWRSDALAACHGAMIVSFVTFLPIYLRVTQSTSASETGLTLLPMMFGIGFGSMLTGRLVSRTGQTAIFPSIGLTAAAILIYALALGMAGLSRPALGVCLFFLGLSMGTVMGVVQVTVQSAAPASSLGRAAASVQLSRSIGAALGTALVGAVLFASLALSGPHAADLFADLLRGTGTGLSGLDPAQVAALEDELARAFRAAFVTVACFGAVGATLAWSIPKRRLQ